MGVGPIFYVICEKELLIKSVTITVVALLPGLVATAFQQQTDSTEREHVSSPPFDYDDREEEEEEEESCELDQVRVTQEPPQW